ncbi:uncharacterized protein LOC135073420 [Ostrinia nubilalis]|uniref:uncharacterized protein LOC135073420 n=1 Tax=Ostrinia nubilalis TaxID=29057 RepID=UPI00308223AE
MFKIPNWEDDVPKSNVDFGKTSKNKKEKKFVEQLKPPQNSKQDTRTEDVKNNKKHSKSNKKKFNKNNSTLGQPNINGSSDFKKQVRNNSAVKNKKKNIAKQPNIAPNEQKHSPIKTSVNNNQPQFNGNSKGSDSKQVNSLDKPKKKSKKRKAKLHESTSANDSQMQESIDDGIDISNPSKPKKKKFNDDHDSSNMVPTKKKKANQDEDLETETKTIPYMTKVDKKKEKFRKLLQVGTNRNPINVSGENLRQRMLERLKAAQFRFLNEKLYTTSGSEAQQLFQSDPEAFHTYHQGYQQQLKKWPVNPLDLIVKRISKMPKTHVIADMGCGEAALSKRVQQTVRSFDLVASAPGVEACDMAHTPLLSDSVDAAVYCLALMGTDLTQYLVEANRVLKVGGHLLIAEVESRFDKVENFTDLVQRLGFKLKNLDKSHEVFFFMEFTKVRDPPAKKSKLPTLTLKPCLYKKR